MKRIFALFLVLILSFALFACGKEEAKPTTSQTTTTAQTTTDGGNDFVKPTDYAAVLTVKINPQFNLYLDKDGKVLALEAINDDARSIESKISVIGKGLEAALVDVVKAANEGGFINDGGAVTIEITEAKDIDVEDIRAKAEGAADAAFKFKVTVHDMTGNESEATTTTKPTTTAPTTQKPTVAEPAILNPKTNLQQGVEYIGNFFEVGTELRAGALQIDGEYMVVTERFFTSTKPEDEGAPPITFNGKTYYSEGGGQNPHYYELTDTEIIIKGSLWEDAPEAVAIKAVLQTNGMIKITQSNNSLFPVGAVYSTNITDVLR